MDSPPLPELDLDLDQLAAELSQLAESRELVLVPAIPHQSRNSGLLVVLSKSDISAAAFCDLAVAAGSRLLYSQAEPFDAEADLDQDLDADEDFGDGNDADAQLATLRDSAKAHNGHIGEIELGFAADGVLHVWIATAPWYDDLMARIEGIMPDADRGIQGIPSAEFRALVDRLAKELIEMPEFTSAPTAAQRRRLALTQHAEIAALDADNRSMQRLAAFQAISRAEMHIAAEVDRKYGEMEGQLTQLAAEFEATPSFRNAGSARARREYARDFLAEKSGGYPPPTRVLELFLDTPPLQRAKTGRH
jgi:hypothetical protein